MSLRIAIGVACVVISSACGGGSATRTIAAAPQGASAVKQRCQAVDSTFALGTPVYRECGVERQARMRGRRPTLDFNPVPPIKDCYNVLIAVVVDERGLPVPEGTRVVRTTDTQYAQAVLNTVPEWRFTPAHKDGIAVKQVVEIGHMIQTMLVRSDRPMNPPRPTRATC